MSNVICPSCQRTVAGVASRCPFCGQDISAEYDRSSSSYEDNFENKGNIFPERKMPTEDREEETTTRSRERKTTRVPRAGSPGRRLIGYRSGHFINRFVSMLYHLAAVMVLIWAYKLTPEYKEKGLAFMHIARVTLGGLILFLPAILLSNTALHRSLPLIRSKSTAKVIIGMLLFLVPLTLLFSYTCFLCK